MDGEGACPSCGHLVIALDDDDPQPSPKAPPKGSPKFSSPPAKKQRPAAGDFLNLTGSWDFSVWLLAISIYSILLHPTLYYLVFMRGGTHRLTVLIAAAAYVPVAYVITRLMCVTDAETGRLKIRNRFLRSIFKKLNSLTLRLS
jgi:hypothetical protein